MRTELILRNFWKYNDKNQLKLVRGIDLVLIFYYRPVAEQEEDDVQYPKQPDTQLDVQSLHPGLFSTQLEHIL